jgi:hypothetical protein
MARITAAEREAHRAFIETLGANAIWRDYLAPLVADDTPSDGPQAGAAVAR